MWAGEGLNLRDVDYHLLALSLLVVLQWMKEARTGAGLYVKEEATRQEQEDERKIRLLLLLLSLGEKIRSIKGLLRISFE